MFIERVYKEGCVGPDKLDYLFLIQRGKMGCGQE